MELKDALKSGPLSGRRLYDETGTDVFSLWKACNKSDGIITRTIGRPYLRFDRKVEGYARLSPALEREFLTYTVIGLKDDSSETEKKALELEDGIKRTSMEKLEVSRKAIQDVMEKMGGTQSEVKKGACFLIGGDVPLEMAHADPRPEKSTGKMVAGSDLDIVVILRDDFPEELEKELDEAIYDVKYQLLTRPAGGEEIDYIIKRLSDVKKQAAFDTFEHMVACKIIDEGQFLWGSDEICKKALELLEKNEIPKKLAELKSQAMEYRETAVEALLRMDELSEDAYTRLFTTTEEFGEIF
jgi:hypothetical protein